MSAVRADTSTTRVGGLPGRVLLELGHQVRFYAEAARHIPRTLRHHRAEVLRLLAIVSFGRGALAVIGGTVVTVGFLTATTGIELGIQGYTQLSDIGSRPWPASSRRTSTPGSPLPSSPASR